ncbi:MAG: hypothetical protein E7417_04035 [Ruminococcaceae bacterium]|nr:hypothetical protein [Oscillospiraceae bacterium]
MSLKTSFCNKTILKSDLKRFWWVGLLETIILFLTNTLPLWDRVSAQVMGITGAKSYDISRLVTWQNGQFLVLIVFAIAVVALVFSYMHQVASVSLYHSVPISRRKLFITKIISAFILTVAPILINMLMIIGIVTASEASFINEFSAPIGWLYTGVIYTILIISLAAFMNMMTGTPIGTLIFSAGAIFLPAMGISFYQFFCECEVYGFSGEYITDFMRWIYISESNLLDFRYCLVYLVLTAVFLCLAYLLYKNRKLEMYGEVIAVSWLKPVFIAIIAIVASMAGYAYFGEVFGDNNIFYTIPLGVLGTVIAWMVSRKSISPKGILKPILSYIIAVLCVIGFVKFDLSGYERRIPDAEDVEWVNVLDVHVSDEKYMICDGERIAYTEKGKVDTKFKDEKGIKDVIAMHRYAVENRTGGKGYNSIPIKYKLKNGKTLMRDYSYSFTDDMDILKPIYNSQQVRAKRYNLLDGTEKKFNSFTVNDRRVKDEVSLYADNPLLPRFIEALKKDLSEISYEDSMLRSGGSIHINIDYNVEIETEKPVEDSNLLKSYTSRGDGIVINEKFVNTMAILEEIGFLAKIPVADDIVSCGVMVWQNDKAPTVVAETYDTEFAMEKYGDAVNKVTDRGEIEELYGLYDEIITDKKYSDYNTCYNVKVIYTMDGHVFEASCSYDEDKMPEIFKKYM